MLEGIASVRTGATPRPEGNGTDETVQRIVDARLDVILGFGQSDPPADILNAARFGVWSFRYGDPERYRGGPAGFWEMVDGRAVTGVVLERLASEGSPSRALATAWFATDGGSLTRNRTKPYFGSSHMVIQKLRELHAWGWPWVEARCADPGSGGERVRIDRYPSNWEVIRWFAPRLAMKAIRSAGRRILRQEEKVDHWSVAIRRARPELPLNGRSDMSGFRWIDSPAGHYYADPFVVERDGRTWLFVEDYDHSKGQAVIACAEVTDTGHVEAPREVLASSGHLSYPYVFFDGSDALMVPESSADGAVRLYRATSFPHEWTPEAVLYPGSAVDTSVWQQDGRWWFFTTVHEPRSGATVLMLFHADTLRGPWQSHPMNPISVDVRRARGAGAIFRDRGRLIRPSQDCSRGYGYSFTFNEIVTLTTTEYHERVLATVSPSWAPGLAGTHTYNRSPGFEVTDAKVRRRLSVQ